MAGFGVGVSFRARLHPARHRTSPACFICTLIISGPDEAAGLGLALISESKHFSTCLLLSAALGRAGVALAAPVVAPRSRELTACACRWTTPRCCTTSERGWPSPPACCSSSCSPSSPTAWPKPAGITGRDTCVASSPPWPSSPSSSVSFSRPCQLWGGHWGGQVTVAPAWLPPPSGVGVGCGSRLALHSLSCAPCKAKGTTYFFLRVF